MGTLPYLSLENVDLEVERIIQKANPTRPKAIVITPTTGSRYLPHAIQSVLSQNFLGVIHLVVVDGSQFLDHALKAASGFDHDRCIILPLPFNTGSSGMNGHRIYASIPLLTNADFVFFLDEDNWMDKDHVGSLIDLLDKDNFDWGYSLRKIYTHDDIYVALDNCESIGPFPPYSNQLKGYRSYVDTNCYAFRRRTIARMAHFWYHPLQADRYFFQEIIKHFPRYSSSNRYTVNYRLKENGPVSPDYIIAGNRHMANKFGTRLPWT